MGAVENSGLSISPDGNAALYPRHMTDSADLMLIENFTTPIRLNRMEIANGKVFLIAHEVGRAEGALSASFSRL